MTLTATDGGVGGADRQTRNEQRYQPAEGITESCGIITRERDVLFLKKTF